MTKVGTKLRKQRERLNLTLAEIAATTNIRENYLAAIERGDHSELPGAVFEKGFIRTYAESLGLDVPSLLEEYEIERPPEDGPSDLAILEKLAEHGSEPPWETRRLRRVLIASGVVAVVALGAWALLRGPGDAHVELPAPATVAPATPAAPSSPPPPSAPLPLPLPAPPATSVPEPAPAVEVPVAAGPAAASRLRVPDHGVGTAVVDRKLVGQSDRFKEGTAVWFWTRVRGGRPGDVVRHVWIHDGRTVGVKDLDIGGSHWRTQSVVTLGAGSSGAWQVEARDEAGRVLARTTFTCD